jgi:3-oxoacyl-[acyl-carrier protein] reductase
MMKPGSVSSPAPRAIVTGSASGIGRAIAVGLLDLGYSVSGIDIADDPDLPGPYSHLRHDLATSEGLAAALAAVASVPTHILVHAAGIMRGDAAQDIAQDHGAALWTLHVAAPQRLAETVLPNMPDHVGRIVVISSRAAQGRAGRGLYAASKAGSEALVRSLALAVLPRGIAVNAVAPGPVITAQSTDPARADAPVALPPIGRMITPEEIAATVLFLVSGPAGAITGQTLVQCGGLSLVPPRPGHDLKEGQADGTI